MDEVTERTDSSSFSLVKGPTRPHEFFDRDVMAIGIDMDLNLDVIERNHYTILDMLSDVGGLASITTGIVALFLSVLNYNNLDSHMIK